MKFVNKTIISDVNTASQTSAVIDANQLISISVQAVFGDNTAAGTLKLQASNDPLNTSNIPVPSVPVNWVDIPNASAAVASGAQVIVVVPQLCARWVRAVYTRSGGGSSTVVVNMMALSV